MSDLHFDALQLPIAIGLVLGILAFIVGWFSVGLHQRRRHEVEGGLNLLRGYRWREFIALLRRLFKARGYQMPDDVAQSGQGGVDLRMDNDAGHQLIKIKHGDSYHVGDKELDELAELIRHHGAAGGILVTSGHGTANLSRRMANHPIELLAGDALWSEASPLLTDDERVEAKRQTKLVRRRARRRCIVFALASILLGASATFSLQRWQSISPAVAHTTGDDQTPVTVEPANPDVATTAPIARNADELAKRRHQAMLEVRNIAGVTAAEWSTRSTLKVLVAADRGPKLDQAIAATHQQTCAMLQPYEELRGVRIELHGVDAKSGSEGPARWKLCEPAP